MYAGLRTIREAGERNILSMEDINRTLKAIKPPDTDPYDTCVTAAQEIIRHRERSLTYLDPSARAFLNREFGSNAAAMNY